MLALVLVLLSQVQPDSRVTRVERVPGGRMEGGRGGVMSYAFFEAFPSSGAGVPAACSTTPPTGAKGETLTFSRTGSATCTKTASGGLATTGIANGDLVVMSANQPRVEYDSNGVKGLLVESSRINSCQRSQEINNAYWLPQSVGVALPVITADYATAPDGTATADRVQFADCPTASNYSLVQSGVSTQTSAAASVYIKGTSGSGSLGVSIYSAGGPNGFTSCSFVADSWTRCVLTATGASANASIFLGCGNGVVNMTYTGGADVLVWGAQLEAGTYATSYIPTTSAAVTRNADLAYFALAGAPGFAVGSMAASINPNSAMSYATPVTTATSTAPPGSGADQLALYAGGTSGASYKCYLGNTAASLAVSGTAAFVAPANGPHRGYCAAGGIGGTLTGGFDTNSMSASGAIPAGPYGAENYLFIGSSNNAITYVDSIVSRVCRDPSPTRCR